MGKPLTLGQRLKTARLGAGLTQSQVADAAMIQRLRYVRFENDEIVEVEKAARDLKALAGVLGLSVGKLTGESDGK